MPEFFKHPVFFRRYDFSWDGVKYFITECRELGHWSIKLPDGYFLTPRDVDHVNLTIVYLEPGYRGTVPTAGHFVLAKADS